MVRRPARSAGRRYLYYIRRMNTKPKLLLLPALLWACCAFAQKTLLYCGRLIDPKTGQVLTEMTVVVTGNSVTGVSKGYTAASAGEWCTCPGPVGNGEPGV